MTSSVGSGPKGEHRYDEASVRCQGSLGGTTVESSVDVGWRPVLLERSRWAPGEREQESHPTTDTRVVVALRGHQQVEAMTDGKWRGAEIEPGAIGMTAGGQTDRLRWRADASFDMAALYLPHEIVAEAAEHLRRAGRRASETTLAHLRFADAAVVGVVESLLVGMRSGAPDLYADQAAHWLATHLLVTHGQAGQSPFSPQAGRLTDRRLERVTEFMRLHHADALSLEALASEACLSKFHFSRLFRARTGMSPHEFLVAERMHAARRLLVDTDLPICDVAGRVGYRTTVQFGVAFRRSHGTTATDFRKRRRG